MIETYMTIKNCERCGGEHADVQAIPFQRRCGRHTHFAICQTTNEPILILQINGDISDAVRVKLDAIRRMEDELINMAGVHAPPAAPVTTQDRPEIEPV